MTTPTVGVVVGVVGEVVEVEGAVDVVGDVEVDVVVEVVGDVVGEVEVEVVVEVEGAVEVVGEVVGEIEDTVGAVCAGGVVPLEPPPQPVSAMGQISMAVSRRRTAMGRDGAVMTCFLFEGALRSPNDDLFSMML
ncbi:MAG: hypothetical protein AB1412_10060 [Pseudomonadota bacterium]